MPHLIRPSVTKVITKDGEVVVHIAIDLNLNLNTGNVQIGVGGEAADSSPKKKDKEEEETKWEIPDFTNLGDNLKKFGEEKE